MTMVSAKYTPDVGTGTPDLRILEFCGQQFGRELWWRLAVRIARLWKLSATARLVEGGGG